MTLRTTLRSLVHAPGYALTTILLLALGIGAASGIFRAVDAVLFHPIAAPEPDRLVRLVGTTEKHDDVFNSSSYPVFRDYHDPSKSFSGLAAFSDWITLHVAVAGAQPERLNGGLASGEFFSLLGAKTALGRTIGPQDDRPGAPAVAVISHAAWRDRFGGDPAAVGSTVLVNGKPMTIVGVLAADFRSPNLLSPRQDVWLAAAQTALADPEWAEMDPLETRHFSWLDIVGRLAPGATIASAQAELDAIAKVRNAAQIESERDPWPLLAPAADYALDFGGEQNERKVSILLLALSGTLLVAAVANATGLGLARALARRRELAVRSAIGAGRGAVIAQVALECVLLAGAAAALAPTVARATLELLRARASGLTLPLDFAEGASDPRSLLFTVALAALAALCFAAAPALAGGRLDLAATLKSDSANAALSHAAPRFRLRRVLVALQAAVAMALLVGAALFLRTLDRTLSVPLGFETDRVVVASLDFGKQGLNTDTARRAIDDVLLRLRGTAGIESAAVASHVPVFRYGMRMTMRPEGYNFAEGEDEAANLSFASSDYFRTLGVRVVAGREFGTEDNASSEPAVVVNEAFVRKYFADGVGVGKRLLDSGPKNGEPVGTIVGVVADFRDRSVRGEVDPAFFRLQSQRGRSRAFVIAKAVPGSEGAAIAAVRAAVKAVDPLLPVHKARTLREHVDEALGTERTLATLVSAAAALTLGLVVAGLVAVSALTVRARTREFGVRLALGAEAARIARMVTGEAAGLVLAGALAGGAVAAFASRFVGALLFGIEPLDPTSYLAALAALVASALVAVLPFARRAARVDAAAALRCE